MNEKNENTINGFETSPTLTPGMNLDARKGTIPRVESDVSQTGPVSCDKVSTKNEKVQQSEIKDVITIEGFGDMTFYTVGLVLDARKAGRAQLKDTKGNNLTSCTEILGRNKHYMEEYNLRDDEIDRTKSQGGILGYDLTEIEELEYNGIQEISEEIFGSDVEKRPTKKEVAKLLNQLDIKRTFGEGGCLIQ